MAHGEIAPGCLLYGKWKKEIAAQAGNPKLCDPASLQASFVALGIRLLVIAANAFGVHAMGDTAIPFLIVSIVLAPGSFIILRYGPEAAEKLDRLHAFRRYLKRFSKSREGVVYQNYGAEWQQVDRFLIYGVALGLSGPEATLLLQATP